MPDDNVDCPHRQQLELTLRHCQDQSELLKTTRDNYLSIIHEFKQDLDELTVQVEQQHLCQPPSSPTTPADTRPERESCEQTHAHAEAVIVLTRHLDASPVNELKLQNERLVCQVESMKSALDDRDKQITKLHSLINGYSDFCENKRLNEEIYVLKKANCNQSHKLREVAALLKNQEDQRLELNNKYEKLSKSFEDQCRELKSANRCAQALQERLGQVEKMQEELVAERNLLREEVVALKSKEAGMMGQERALCDQLKHERLELDKSRKLVRDMQCQLHHQSMQHRQTVCDLNHANEAIRQQLHDLVLDCKQMQLKLKQQTEVTNQQQQIIESFRKWKDAQVRSDEAMRQCVKRAEEHICILLEDNQRLCEEYRRMHQDYCVLEVEMDRVRDCVNSRMAPTPGLSGGAEKTATLNVTDEMAKRLQHLYTTSQRLSEHCRSLSSTFFEYIPEQLQQQSQMAARRATTSQAPQSGVNQSVETDQQR